MKKEIIKTFKSEFIKKKRKFENRRVIFKDSSESVSYKGNIKSSGDPINVVYGVNEIKI